MMILQTLFFALEFTTIRASLFGFIFYNHSLVLIEFTNVN